MLTHPPPRRTTHWPSLHCEWLQCCHSIALSMSGCTYMTSYTGMLVSTWMIQVNTGKTMWYQVNALELTRRCQVKPGVNRITYWSQGVASLPHKCQPPLPADRQHPSRLGLSHWDPYTVHRGGCLELYYCNTVEWCWWDSSLICKTSWFPSVLWHCWFGYMTCKNRPRYDL